MGHADWISKMNIEAELYGKNLFGDPLIPESRGNLTNKYFVPPFTVLNARSGRWQERKRAWLAMGIKSEIGRSSKLTYAFDQRAIKGKLDHSTTKGTSVFDPVMCEMAYRWWCPEGGQVVDPFAGGSVRGVVAAKLGLRYWGNDLCEDQIHENMRQAIDLSLGTAAEWRSGDSNINVPDAPMADFIFSCPPYGDLERYSKDPKDLSNMEYKDFLRNYCSIVSKTCERLKDNRFACFVVGDYRDRKTGLYRGFVHDTIDAFALSGLGLYNEGILITQVASLALTSDRQFSGGRKLTKVHQNVLVFVKGDWKVAVGCLPEIVNIYDPDPGEEL